MDGTSILAKLEDVGRAGLTWVEHAALNLVGAVATAEQTVNSLEASSPLVKVAIDAGIAAAQSHGVPVGAIENAEEQVIAAASGVAAALRQTAASPAPAATVAGGAA